MPYTATSPLILGLSDHNMQRTLSTTTQDSPSSRFQYTTNLVYWFFSNGPVLPPGGSFGKLPGCSWLPHERGINAFKLWCWRRLLRVPWTARRSVRPKGNQPWIFIGRTDAEAEAPILWPPDAKSWLIGKDPNAEKDWGQEEKGATEDEIVGWHHWRNVHEFEQVPGDDKGQENLAFCSLWGCKESDMTYPLEARVKAGWTLRLHPQQLENIFKSIHMGTKKSL